MQFTFQLPDTAFISNFTMTVGNKTFPGIVKEKGYASTIRTRASLATILLSTCIEVIFTRGKTTSSLPLQREIVKRTTVIHNDIVMLTNED
jgi:hypothetical protein